MSSSIYDPAINRPGKRKEPFGVGILMKASFDDHTEHAISKCLMTYIYVLLLRKTARLLGGGDEFLVHASVQARTGNGKKKTEGSHILLREVSFGGTYAYALKDIPQGLKGALIYCAAQVNITPGSYNRTDQLLEEPEPTLQEYLNLVRVMVREEEDSPEMRGRLFDAIVKLFTNALVTAKTFADHLGSGEKASGAVHLQEYALALLKFQCLKDKIVTRSTEDWMYAIRINGGWEVKNQKSWESIRNRIYLSEV